jgi:putative toxin-antitoxin system antitoxin component (TIGR02293 family)
MDLAVFEHIYLAAGPEKVSRLNAGVKAPAFAALAEAISVSTAILAEALGLSERTMRHRTSKPAALLTADETERSFRVYRVLRRATEVLGDAEAAKSWMTTPQKALGKKTPLSLLARDVGTEEVLNVLTALEHGVVL